MAFNQQQFILDARKKGVPDQEIYNYLQSKGLISAPVKTTPEKKASGGFLGYVAPALATLPQAVGLGVGAKQNTKTVEGISSTLQSQSDVAVDLLKRIQNEKDVVKKTKLQQDLKNLGINSQQLNSLSNELASAKGLENATAIKLGPFADIPGLSTDPTRATQQIVGRSISQIGASAAPQLGATGAGAVLGAGRGIEAGESPLGVVAESAKYAAGAKLFSYGFDKIAGTQFGERILTSPIGSTVLKVGNKIFSPFLATSSEAGTFGATVDAGFKKFGSAVDRVYSPSTYLKPAKNALTYAGEKTGVIGNSEQRLADSQKKITNYWENQANRYKDVINYDKNSPRVLGEEGIIPKQRGTSLDTADQAIIVRQKASSEHSYLNKIFDESRLYGSIDEYKRVAMQQINQNFQGVQKQQALQAFEKQFDALVKDNARQIIEGVDGQRLPLKVFNDMKSYMWSEGYGPKLVKSDDLYARTMRTAGNAAKNYIDSVARAESLELAETISKLNQHSGDLLQAAKFLETMNGRKLPLSQLGRYFAQLTGSVVGSGAGPLGSAAGALTANELVSIFQNPNVSVGRAAILVAQLRQTNPQVVEDALRILGEMGAKQAAVKLLQAGPMITPLPADKSGAIPIPSNYPQYPAPPASNRLLPPPSKKSGPTIKLPKKFNNKTDYIGN